jgi:flagellar M-ring protein FliF
MAEETTNAAANIKIFFNRFSTSRKIVIGIVVLFSIAAIILLINLTSTLTYGILYSNLSTRDSGLIIEQLRDRKVPYKLSANGSVIKVPDDQVAELRIELAAAGLPESGGVGFEIFDKTSLSTTDFGQMDYRRKMEQNLTKKIIALLEPHVGEGKVRANVKLKLNFDKMETTEEKVDPESIAKVSEKSEGSSSTGAERMGGVPGVRSNVGQSTGGEAGARAGAAAPLKSKSEKSFINYEVSKKITRLTKPIGEIERISVAVVVDDALVDVREQRGELIKQFRKRTAEELETIKKIAQAAVGFDNQRGDIIEVANLPFDTSAEKVSKIYQEIHKPTTLDRVEKFFSTFLGIVTIIAVILLIIFLFRKPLFRGIEAISRATRLPKPGEVEIPRVDTEKLSTIREAKDEAEIEQELMETYKVPRSTKKMSIIKAKVKRFASENKDETASLVKSFLIED